MPKTTFNTTNVSDGTWNSNTEVFEMRDIAAAEARYLLEREFPLDIRDFIRWLINNDPDIKAKFIAFMACRRIGVDV